MMKRFKRNIRIDACKNCCEKIVCTAVLIFSNPVAAQGLNITDLQRAADQDVAALRDRTLIAMAAGPAVFGPTTAALLGSWHGVFACSQASHRVQMEITRAENGLLQARYTQRPLAGNDPSRPAFDAALVVSYQPASGQVALTSATLRPAPRAPLPQAAQGLALPDGTGIVLGTRFPTACSPITLRRGSGLPGAWKFFETLEPPASQHRLSLRLPGILSDLTNLFSRGCPDAALRWVGQLPALQGQERSTLTEQWNLFADAYFVPFFGKPFFTHSDAERDAIGEKLQTDCSRSAPYAEASRLLVGGVIEAFRNRPGSPRLDLAATNIAQTEMRLWAQQIRQRLQTPVETALPATELVNSLQAAAGPLLQLLWPTERESFVRSLRDAAPQLAVAAITARIRAGAGSDGEGLYRLEQLTKSVDSALRERQFNAEQAQDLQRQLDEALNRDAPAAAAQLARAYDAPVQVDGLRRWRETYPGVAARLRPSVREAVNDTFAARRGTLVRQAVDDERSAARAIADEAKQSDASRLRTLVSRQRKLDELQTPYLDGTEWQSLQAELVSLRQPLLAAAVPEIAHQAQSASQRGDIDRLLHDHVAVPDRDTPAGRALLIALQPRLLAVSPFRELPAGDYMDAIYGGDFEQARAIDRRMAALLRNDIREAVDRITGLPADARRDAVAEGFLATQTGPRTSLAHALASAYLVNFQVRPTRRCLGDSWTKVTITTTLVERGRNALGPYEKPHGSSSREVHIKSDLKPLIEWVNLEDPTVANAMIGLFSGKTASAVNDLLASTKRLMEGFDCDSLAVLKFEKQLMAYLRSIRSQ